METERGAADLTGRVALITGGAVRIGRAIALAIAERGARVAVHYHRSASQAEHTVAAIRSQGHEALALQADLRDAGRAGDLVDRVVAAWGQVDILVNSASAFARGTILDTDEANWDDHLAINLKAPFFLCQSFARQVAERRGCHIINLSDWRVERPGTSHMAYVISKTGLITMTQALARALGPQVRVNAIAPGAILPPPHGDDGGYFARVVERLPLRQTGSPDDIVRAVLYLLDAPFVTGEVLHVTGGEHL